jgi:hypothetical protein
MVMVMVKVNVAMSVMSCIVLSPPAFCFLLFLKSLDASLLARAVEQVIVNNRCNRRSNGTAGTPVGVCR